jgi:hypothetical protein
LPPPKNVKFAASTAPDFTSASSMLRAAAVETQYDDPVGAPSTVAMQVETYYDVDEDPALYEHGDQRASDQSIVAPKHDQQFPESPIIRTFIVFLSIVGCFKRSRFSLQLTNPSCNRLLLTLPLQLQPKVVRKTHTYERLAMIHQ